MTDEKIGILEAAGWQIEDHQAFLGLSDEEALIVEAHLESIRHAKRKLRDISLTLKCKKASEFLNEKDQDI